MKKKIIFANMLIIAVVVVLSCQNDKEGRVPEQNYPIKIEFTNFAWDGNHNLWTNLDYDGKVIIINSIEELLNYVNSLDDNDYADIDFSKYSLLLASGISDYGISDIKAKTFQQLAENHYELEIEITLNDVLECEQWLLAVIVDKLSADSKVDLKITIGNCEFENPLTDLPWLKEKVDEIILLLQSNTNFRVKIYQCMYGNEEIGFLIDEGNIKHFYNCNGYISCIMGGDAGETCSELNITSKELIWEINN